MSSDEDLTRKPTSPVLVRIAQRLAAGAVVASTTLGGACGDDDAQTDAGIIAPMPPPMDASLEPEEDAGIIAPMPPPMDASLEPDPIPPMPPPMPDPDDMDPVPPMPPPPSE
jgi:hypothetical protein